MDVRSFLNGVESLTPIYSEKHDSYFYMIHPTYNCVIELKNDDNIMLHYRTIEELPVSKIENIEQFTMFLLSTIFSGNVNSIKID